MPNAEAVLKDDVKGSTYPLRLTISKDMSKFQLEFVSEKDEEGMDLSFSNVFDMDDSNEISSFLKTVCTALDSLNDDEDKMLEAGAHAFDDEISGIA